MGRGGLSESHQGSCIQRAMHSGIIAFRFFAQFREMKSIDKGSIRLHELKSVLFLA
jgi:hypothetical protein